MSELTAAGIKLVIDSMRDRQMEMAKDFVIIVNQNTWRAMRQIEIREAWKETWRGIRRLRRAGIDVDRLLTSSAAAPSGR